jgi:hypothetical protein
MVDEFETRGVEGIVLRIYACIVDQDIFLLVFSRVGFCTVGDDADVDV